MEEKENEHFINRKKKIIKIKLRFVQNFFFYNNYNGKDFY